MAPRYTDPDCITDTDGGEARPRPHKAQRLLDVMEGNRRKAPRPAASSPASEAPAPFRPASSKPASKSTPTPPARRASAVSTPFPPHPSAPVSSSVSHMDTDAYTILSVTPEGEGETVAVILSVPSGEVERITAGKDTPTDGKPQKLKLRLLVEQYTDLKPRVGAIALESAEELMEAARLCGAVCRGMALLQYGDQSARRLAYKLTHKGVDRETAARAAAYLAEKGYIREDSTATLRAEQGLRKGWGERRIREDLVAHGFTREAVEEAMESLSETDWEENCAAAIRKKYGEIPEDRGERQKLVAAMMRLGYDTDTVKEAMRDILRES